MNRGILLLFAATLLARASAAHAAAAPFTQNLTAEEQDAAGVSSLSDDQTAMLNNLVEREVRLARQGNVPAFSSEFTARRSAPERVKAGIESLTAEQRATLDHLVARSIATGEERDVTVTTRAPKPEFLEGFGPKPFIRGEASFTVGTAGEGRNFYGGSIYVEQVDPQKGYTLGIGYSEYRGKGLWFDDGWYDYRPHRYGYPYGRRGWRY